MKGVPGPGVLVPLLHHAFLGKVVASNFIEITLWHVRSPVNLLHIFRTRFPKSTSERMLLISFQNQNDDHKYCEVYGFLMALEGIEVNEFAKIRLMSSEIWRPPSKNVLSRH